jgi:CyaY protein
MVDEKQYRALVEELFKSILRVIDKQDPDVIEADLAAGVVTVLLGPKRSKIILSPQPPVKQVWLAAAHLGVARHFNRVGQQWVDDKDPGLELTSYLSKLVADGAGLRLAF